jgi:hypothetical protein
MGKVRPETVWVHPGRLTFQAPCLSGGDATGPGLPTWASLTSARQGQPALNASIWPPVRTGRSTIPRASAVVIPHPLEARTIVANGCQPSGGGAGQDES